MYFCAMDRKEWFASWFDTAYYHILYKDRDKHEAARFVKKLCQNLNLPENSNVLDLACGMGRHSLTLHNLDFNVLGADLSENSIKQARKDAPEGLEFIVHDMRKTISGRKFDVVFNLFTSFGYFDNSDENEKVLQSIHEMLKTDGRVVIDFLNATKVVKNLEHQKIISRSGIDFHITKRFDGTHIFKEIRFEDKGQHFHFEERVQALTLENFKSLFQATGFDILSTFGDLELNAFDEINSDRLILVAKKR